MMPIHYSDELEFARQLDIEDDLGSYRDEFVITDPNMLYMDGNSLGRLPRHCVERLEQAVKQEWGRDLIRAWGQGWFDAPQRVGEKIAGLVGAAPGQVIVSDSTSINLFKLVMAALALRPGRKKIISDVMNFPSDLYILQGCLRLAGAGYHLHLVPARDGIRIEPADLLTAIDNDTALVVLSHVVFKSGFLYDAATITEQAERKGALVLWDLCHSVGVVPIELDRWGAHMATSCTYKYLNGGPGAPAFLYVQKELQDEALSPIWGWFGQQSPFAFELNYHPSEGIKRFLCSSPPILSLLAMEQGIDLAIAAGIERVRQKSVLLTDYLIFLFECRLEKLGFELGTPREANLRGSHVSLRHPHGYQINRALIEEMEVIPDFREPDNIRLGLAPLYTTFADVWQVIERIRLVVEEERYLHYPVTRMVVT
jgi:kynureninase